MFADVAQVSEYIHVMCPDVVVGHDASITAREIEEWFKLLANTFNPLHNGVGCVQGSLSVLATGVADQTSCATNKCDWRMSEFLEA